MSRTKTKRDVHCIFCGKCIHGTIHTLRGDVIAHMSKEHPGHYGQLLLLEARASQHKLALAMIAAESAAKYGVPVQPS